MKIFKILALGFCLISIGSCSIFGSSYSRMISNSGIISKNFLAESKFNFDTKLIVVKAIIKGKEYEFIFDTGAAISILSKDAADALNLQEKGSININDSQGNRQRLGTGIIDTINLGGVLFKDIAVSIIDWPENSAIKCIGKDGLIGNNLIRQCNWIIDYENENMIISDDYLGNEEYVYVEMKYGKSRPRIDIKINDQNLTNILLDLGSGGGLDISKTLAKDLQLSPEKNQGIYTLDGSSQGLFGSKLDSVCTLKIDSLSFGNGDYSLYNASLDLESKKGGKIGNEILGHGLLHLDYKNKKVGFKAYEEETRLGDKKSFSFAPSLGDSGIFISSLVLEGKADKLGLSYGDKIISLNGKKHKDFPDYCSYFDFIYSDLRKGDSLVLVLEKKPEELVTFYKKALWEK